MDWIINVFCLAFAKRFTSVFHFCALVVSIKFWLDKSISDLQQWGVAEEDKTANKSSIAMSKANTALFCMYCYMASVPNRADPLVHCYNPFVILIKIAMFPAYNTDVFYQHWNWLVLTKWQEWCILPSRTKSILRWRELLNQ